ncbi:hypothetical protein Y032_0002g763 [Ancylostoma ceylanicum]|uniref:Uncharacterized protein n=1 Tax=Ancylostoma ceylanicum TaxID=53326 RepID=A0A016W256_9BILA|nr:hypothetical protein Y032_0002g763 [Ancylostoma ceylanicum]
MEVVLNEEFPNEEFYALDRDGPRIRQITVANLKIWRDGPPYSRYLPERLGWLIFLYIFFPENLAGDTPVITFQKEVVQVCGEGRSVVLHCPQWSKNNQSHWEYQNWMRGGAAAARDGDA